MALLSIEFLLLFLVGPALFAYARHRIPAIPALWAMTAYCLFVMWHDPQLEGVPLWKPVSLVRYLPSMLSFLSLFVVVGIVLIRRYAPKMFLSFPKSKPVTWASVMVLYPILSVYPQGIVYRGFLFGRYRDLFRPDWAIVLASAIAFAWVHVVFRNRLAVGLSFLAGLLFAARYLQTGSLFVSSFEHALYGCAVFTIGLGRWFYHAPVLRQSRSVPYSLDS